MLLFENTFLFKYVSTLVFYWICDQINILLFDVRYVKKKIYIYIKFKIKKKKKKRILWRKKT